MASASLAYFNRILDLIVDKGISRQDCLKAVNLAELPMNAPKFRVPLDKLDGVLWFAAKKLDQPLLGIHLSLNFRINQYTRLANILALCDDIEHAAATSARYSCLVHSVGTPTGIVKGSKNGFDKILWSPNYPSEKFNDHRQTSEFIMANYVTSVNYLSWSLGKGVEILRLDHDPAAPMKDYEDLLGCRVEFRAGEYATVLRKDIAGNPMPTANPVQFAILKAKQEKILASYMQRDNLVFRVEEQIRESIGLEKPIQREIAAALGLSERSMRRYLAEQQTSFKVILESVKRDLASIKLSQGLPLSDISHALWYSDQAAFTRAYKKWHGITPGRHRSG